jgi:hypothetical protein
MWSLRLSAIQYSCLKMDKMKAQKRVAQFRIRVTSKMIMNCTAQLNQQGHIYC